MKTQENMPGKNISLYSIYGYWHKSDPFRFLYRLLEEREPHVAISHKEMPTYEDHLKFVRSEPYDMWYIIYNSEHEPVGSVYITHDQEIGIFILKKHRGKGYGSSAVKRILWLDDDKVFFANINPANEESIKFFERHGFKLARKEEKQLVYQWLPVVKSSDEQA